MSKLTTPQIEEMRSVIANLDGLQGDIVAAVKRKASEQVSAFQLKLINGVLAKANALLKVNKPISSFEAFDPDDLPTAGDVGMVVSQYVEALEKVRCGNINKGYDGSWHWSEDSAIHTVPPRARK